jgi:hypothetical protein
MSTYIEKNKGNQIDSNSSLNSTSSSEGKLEFMDNRSEGVSQMKLQHIADSSTRVKQLEAYQNMADNHIEATEKSTNNGVIQMVIGRMASRFARPMAKGAARLGTGLGLLDAGLDAKKKFSAGDNLGGAMSVGGAFTGLFSDRFGHAASMAGNLRDGDYGQAMLNASGTAFPKFAGLSMAATGISAKNIGEQIPFNNSASQEPNNDLMGWWAKNNMQIPENYMAAFSLAIDEGKSHEEASSIAKKTLDDT